jgi:hypothetical protein
MYKKFLYYDVTITTGLLASRPIEHHKWQEVMMHTSIYCKSLVKSVLEH